jgi:hypothetical protein
LRRMREIVARGSSMLISMTEERPREAAATDSVYPYFERRHWSSFMGGNDLTGVLGY